MNILPGSICDKALLLGTNIKARQLWQTKNAAAVARKLCEMKRKRSLLLIGFIG